MKYANRPSFEAASYFTCLAIFFRATLTVTGGGEWRASMVLATSSCHRSRLRTSWWGCRSECRRYSNRASQNWQNNNYRSLRWPRRAIPFCACASLLPNCRFQIVASKPSFPNCHFQTYISKLKITIWLASQEVRHFIWSVFPLEMLMRSSH